MGDLALAELPVLDPFYARPQRDTAHVYTNSDGQKLWSVTEVLKAAGYVDYSGVPEDILQFAATRGTAVHRACHYLNLGILNESSVDPQIAGYVESYRQAIRAMGAKILASEIMLQAPVAGLAGELDFIALVGKEIMVVDIKSYAKSQESTKYQLAAYCYLYQSNFPNLPDPAVAELKLDKDGKIGKLTRLDPDWYIDGFMAALTTCKIKNQIHGGIQ